MNLEGFLLTTIGFVVFAIGAIMMIIANKKKTNCTPLWTDQSVGPPIKYIRSSGGQEPPFQHPSYLFSLQYPSLVKGAVTETEGSFELYICEYFDSRISPISLSKSKILYEAKSEDLKPFQLEMPPGNYWAFFFCKSANTRGKFNLTECHQTKPHRQWFSIGQTLWEVGIPVLIVGLVSLILI
jgi:hypothetical protein